VRISAILMRCAAGYAALMADEDHFGHTDPDGGDARDRMDDEGYPDSGWGEIILYGQRDWLAAYWAWWNSPPHRAVMLDGRLTEVGVAVGVEPGYDRPGDVYDAGCAVFGAARTAPPAFCADAPPRRPVREPRRPRTHLPDEDPPRDTRRLRRVRRWLGRMLR
jgi:hypothetical protein